MNYRSEHCFETLVPCDLKMTVRNPEVKIIGSSQRQWCPNYLPTFLVFLLSLPSRLSTKSAASGNPTFNF